MGVRSNVLAGDSIIAIPLTLLLMIMFATRKDVEWDRRRDTATAAGFLICIRNCVLQDLRATILNYQWRGVFGNNKVNYLP